MRVLGIDPGLARLGYAVVETDGSKWEVHTYGLITTDRHCPVAERLKTIYEDVSMLAERYRPEVMVVEQLLFSRNVTTAMLVSEVRGVVLLAAAERGIGVDEIAPTQLKKAVCGNGRATKTQMQRSLQRFLGLATLPTPDDVADALALAFVGLVRLGGRQR